MFQTYAKLEGTSTEEETPRDDDDGETFETGANIVLTDLGEVGDEEGEKKEEEGDNKGEEKGILFVINFGNNKLRVLCLINKKMVTGTFLELF